ncbi:MAG: hypothetical protein IT316_07695 [Anaerolineales bacterium]|nr:hypothetical protein [Anaerolineales bacterium]
MMSKLRFLATAMILSVLLSACYNAPQTPEIPGLANTLAVRTLVAQQGVSYFATSTPSPEPALAAVFDEAELSNYYAELESQPTPTPVPSLTPIGQNLESYQFADVCNNKAQFVRDVTFSDLSEVKPGQRFTKVWQMLNSGTCDWNPKYSIVFSYGDRMGGLTPKPIGVKVSPGEMIEIAIDLVAPTNTGVYQGNWLFQDDAGEQFGTSSGPNNFFWVSIAVGRVKGIGGFGPIFGNCGGGG